MHQKIRHNLVKITEKNRNSIIIHLCLDFLQEMHYNNCRCARHVPGAYHIIKM